MYVAVFPNLLISLHPDYVMTHRLTPLAADRTRDRVRLAVPRRRSRERDGFDPAYAVDFWDLTNRQDWAPASRCSAACPASTRVPGPLAPEEDGVQQFVARVARGYLRSAEPRRKTRPALDVGRDDPRSSPISLGRAGERVAVEHGEVGEQPDLEPPGRVVQVVHVGAARGVGASARSPRSSRLRGVERLRLGAARAGQRPG